MNNVHINSTTPNVRIGGDINLYPQLEDLDVRPTAERQTFNHPNSYGYDKVTVEPIDIRLQEKTVNPAVIQQKVEADSGYDALKEVTVTSVTSSIDANIQPENIKNGVTILGVDGTTPTPEELFKINPTGSDLTGSTYVNGISRILKTIPLIDTSEITDFTNMFSRCNNLVEIPLLDTSNAVNMAGFVNGCTSLVRFPLLDTSNVTNMSSAISGCYSLIEIAPIDTSNVTTFRGAFSNCTALENFPQIDCSSALECGLMFDFNRALIEIPDLNMSSCTNFSSMARYCSALKKAGLIDMSSATSISGMLTGSNSIRELKGFKDLGKAFLTSAPANKTEYTMDIRFNSLTHDSLMNVINNLWDIASDGVAQQKLMIGATNIAKLTAQELSIASDKGWAIS